LPNYFSIEESLEEREWDSDKGLKPVRAWILDRCFSLCCRS